MEELLPLIIGILWLAYTFYSKGQKKKQREGSPSPIGTAKKKPSFLEQLLAGEGIQLESSGAIKYEEDEVYDPFEKQEPVYKKTTKQKESTPFLQSELSEYKGEGMTRFASPYQDDQKWSMDIDVSTSDFSDQLHDFDLKKAVVYSEILNAPYIDYK